ncbi:DUF4192 domain-containing protein [Streptomyces sp. N2-109]|uniref:DUF4192 domain-containing protein n=1 Tax=Streptomyces gossypii TaxID=2883101 RepID=A0ABT2JRX6_9ACTN|nr:DUF4192 domain-containing protein [Streptomyces gossypii]MCT2590617.1 DUF4192 domain-containing protein [Streptomyces gossypii]
MTQHTGGHTPDPSLSGGAAQVALRGPSELADALPYLLGFHPTDSIVVVALHGERGRFGGRLRMGIPATPDEWAPVASQLAACLQSGSLARGGAPDGALVFLCQDPPAGGSGRAVMERLRPLAQRMRTACGELEMPVFEALCLSGGRYWSYCCPETSCCPAEGTPLALPGTSAMAAAATFAGIHVQGSLKEMEARVAPLACGLSSPQERALDKAAAALVPRMLSSHDRDAVSGETVRLARRLIDRFRGAARADGTDVVAEADARDDALLSHDEAAILILGLQDRGTRDRAAEWMEGREAAPALRLWRALSRRCVGTYAEHSVAPLTLAGWVAWSSGDEPSARVAFGRALDTDPDYVFAQLLHRACNEGLDPEPLRRCMREERATRRRKRRGGRPGVARRTTS